MTTHIRLSVRMQEIATRPTDDDIIATLALHYRVHELKVIEWLIDMDLDAAAERAAANL